MVRAKYVTFTEVKLCCVTVRNSVTAVTNSAAVISVPVVELPLVTEVIASDTLVTACSCKLCHAFTPLSPGW